jgi:hypothetical protein
MGVFRYLPVALQSLNVANSLYDKTMKEQASASAVNRWDQKYLIPVLNDCSDGAG